MRTGGFTGAQQVGSEPAIDLHFTCIVAKWPEIFLLSFSSYIVAYGFRIAAASLDAGRPSKVHCGKLWRYYRLTRTYVQEEAIPGDPRETPSHFNLEVPYACENTGSKLPRFVRSPMDSRFHGNDGSYAKVSSLKARSGETMFDTCSSGPYPATNRRCTPKVERFGVPKMSPVNGRRRRQ